MIQNVFFSFSSSNQIRTYCPLVDGNYFRFLKIRQSDCLHKQEHHVPSFFPTKLCLCSNSQKRSPAKTEAPWEAEPLLETKAFYLSVHLHQIRDIGLPSAPTHTRSSVSPQWYSGSVCLLSRCLTFSINTGEVLESAAKVCILSGAGQKHSKLIFIDILIVIYASFGGPEVAADVKMCLCYWP